MKTKIKNILLGAALTIFPLIAQAGTEGHGGVGIRCPLASIPFQLYDLYQVTIPGLYSDQGFEILRTRDSTLSYEDDVKAQIEKAFQKLEAIDQMSARLAKNARSAINSVIMKKAQALPVLDIAEPAPVGCSYEGLMVWHDSEDDPFESWLEVDWNKVQQLPVTDQAALWVHEAILRVRRVTTYQLDLNPPTSMYPHLGHYPSGAIHRDRRLVATLFTKEMSSNLETEKSENSQNNFILHKHLGTKINVLITQNSGDVFECKYLENSTNCIPNSTPGPYPECSNLTFSFRSWSIVDPETYPNTPVIEQGKMTEIDLSKVSNLDLAQVTYSAKLIGAAPRACSFLVEFFDNQKKQVYLNALGVDVVSAGEINIQKDPRQPNQDLYRINIQQ